MAVPDIPAYLGFAQWAGGSGLALSDAPFQPGYGLLIAPLVAAAHVFNLGISGISGVSGMAGVSGESVHHMALVVNALAATAAVVVAGRLGWVASSRRWVAWVAGLLAALHPSMSSASRIAWPETVLALVVLACALAVATASARAWMWAGLLASLAVALHARMIVLVTAVVLAALLYRIDRRQWRALAMGVLAGGIVTAAALTFTGTWPTQRVGEATQLDRGLEPIATVAGQLLALGGGTVGLGLVGLIAGLAVAISRVRRPPGCSIKPTPLRKLSDPAEDHAGVGNLSATPTLPCPEMTPEQSSETSHSTSPPTNPPKCPRKRLRIGPTSSPANTALTASGSLQTANAALVFVALGALGTVLVGGWTLTGSERADAVLYGRYVDPWAVPLAIVTLAWIVAVAQDPHRNRRSNMAAAGSTSGRASDCATDCASGSVPGSAPRSALGIVLITAIAAVSACAVIVVVAGGYDAPARRIMILSFSLWWTWFGSHLSAVALAALGCTLLGAVLVAVALRGSRTALGVLLATVLALGAVITVSNHRRLAEIGEVASGQVTAASEVGQAVADDGLTCLAHDSVSVPDYALWLYRLEVPQIEHARVQLQAGDRPCSELVIAHDSLAERCANARQITNEPAAAWALWQLPERICASTSRSTK